VAADPLGLVPDDPEALARAQTVAIEIPWAAEPAADDREPAADDREAAADDREAASDDRGAPPHDRDAPPYDRDAADPEPPRRG
jgi:hypothetical protein